MNNGKIQPHGFYIVAPLLGIGIFILLYMVAAAVYPGGSNADAQEKGFNFLNNYWCDLLSYWAKNGDYNTSRPFAITASLFLTSSLVLFWYALPQFMGARPGSKKVIQFTGIASMVFTMFLFTAYHNLIVNIAGLSGVIAFLTTFIVLYKSKWYNLLALGIFCLAMCFINYLIFETNRYLGVLPVLQKLTFALYFLWVALVDIYIISSK